MANKAQFIEAVANRLGGDRKQGTAAVDAFIDTVYEYVVKDPKGVTITGFGRFYKQPRAARMGRNPATGAPVRVKKSVAAKFSAGSELKKVVSGEKKLAKAPARKATAAKAPAKKATPAKAAKSAPASAAKSASNGTARKTAPTKTAAKRTTAPATKVAAKKAPAKKAAAKKATASGR